MLPVTRRPSRGEPGSGAKIFVHPEVHSKLSKAKRANRGTHVHLSPEGLRTTAELEGGSVGSFLKRLWNFAKKDLWPAIKPAVSGVLDAALQPVANILGPYGMTAPLGRAAIRNLTGVGVSGQKKMVKRSPKAKAHMAALRDAKAGLSTKLNLNEL
ncbi:hypothetical protein PybrP1_012538 [[Pythium] brassicae (nom. inval.)]|nr:hypothetical protein PybrP1_012538 [[Pythium] brassicae (nom. inval.)]